MDWVLASNTQLYSYPMPYLVPRDLNYNDYTVPVNPDQIFLNVTEGVSIKPLHSHNDYTREVPLLEALSYGVQSVEADIWSFADNDSLSASTSTVSSTVSAKQLAKDSLYVSHTLVDIKQDWTLESLYLDPLWRLLDESKGKGVFLNDPDHTLFLFLDFKTGAEVTWPLVVKSLQRFKDANYLTYYNNNSSSWVVRPITVVLTGNQPTEAVKKLDVRYVTLDGDLTVFKTGTDDTMKKYSIVASSSMTDVLGGVLYQVWPFTSSNKETIETVFDNAHSSGIKTRIWGGVTWLAKLRDEEDQFMYEAGTDLLNIDDLSTSGEYPERA